MLKKYVNQKTGETTQLARKALKWHKQGDNIEVVYVCDINTIFHKVAISGAKQENKRYDENRNHCKWIANTVRDYANGRYYECPDCGETIYTTEDWSGEKYKCPNCGEVIDYYDLRPLTLWDYFDDVFDIEYRIDSNKEYRSVRVMVACGGPNIYIDTASKNVELYWWTESAHYPIDYDTVEEIDNYFEELFECL